MPETAEEAVARLAALPLFAGLGPEVLKPLATALRERRLAAGELLCGRGEVGDRLFVVIEGRLRVSVVTAEGRELSMRIVGAGEMAGEIAAFDGGRRTTDMTAIAPSRVASLACETLFAAMDAHPRIARNALKMLCGRLRDTTNQLETIALYPIEQRLARLLLVAMGGLETTPGRRTPVALDLSQTEIAQLLGATRSKVNVALGRLEQAGALRRTSDRMFCDRSLLERFAEVGHALPA
jgi:CRP-like cAMP-binding protein